jgi:hypothetical protein
MLLKNVQAMRLVQVLDEFHTVHLLSLGARCRVTIVLSQMLPPGRAESKVESQVINWPGELFGPEA